MPIVAALLGLVFFREVVGPRQWLGFALGFAGVALAVGEGIAPSRAGGGACLAVLAGLFAISAGTVYQKHHGSDVDPRSGLALQNLAATVLLLPLAAHEGFLMDGSAAVFASLGWMIGVNSLTAFGLFFVLLRRGAVNQVAALFFLMPPVTAVIDFLVLGDTLTPYKLAGLAFAALGVYLATRPRGADAASAAVNAPPSAAHRVAHPGMVSSDSPLSAPAQPSRRSCAAPCD
jgi:drug/metabolite transporter (DMT)-like permease